MTEQQNSTQRKTNVGCKVQMRYPMHKEHLRFSPEYHYVTGARPYAHANNIPQYMLEYMIKTIPDLSTGKTSGLDSILQCDDLFKFKDQVKEANLQITELEVD